MLGRSVENATFELQSVRRVLSGDAKHLTDGGMMAANYVATVTGKYL